MITNEYVREMAAYSRWQNDSIYQCCDEIGDEQRKLDRGMFFGSIHNTLDHICVVNRAILTFLDGSMPEQTAPGQAVWPEWDELKSTCQKHDSLLMAGAREWTEAWLAGNTTKINPGSDELPAIPRWLMVVQLFNHQTHHRSQVTSALHSMGIDYGATDIPWRPGAGFFAG